MKNGIFLLGIILILSFSFIGCDNGTTGGNGDPTNHTVTFNSNGGSSITGSPFTITHGQTVSKPTDPTRSGFTFVKWLKDGVEYNFSSPVTSSFTLTGEWETFVLPPDTGSLQTPVGIRGTYVHTSGDKFEIRNYTVVITFVGQNPIVFTYNKDSGGIYVFDSIDSFGIGDYRLEIFPMTNLTITINGTQIYSSFTGWSKQ